MEERKKIIKEMIKKVGNIVVYNIEKISKHPESEPHHKFAKEFAGTWLLTHLSSDLNDLAEKELKSIDKKKGIFQ